MSKHTLPTSCVNVTENTVQQRIDNFLKNKFKKLPKSLIYKILRTGQVRINKKRISPNYKLQLGDKIRIPPIKLKSKINYLKKTNSNLSSLFNDITLYEDDYLLILNKPSGMAVHSGSGINYGIIENLRMIYPNHVYLDLVHRLDRDTSGILLIAKKRSMLRKLHEQIREKKIKKKYIAVVHGIWPKNLTYISKPLLKISLKNGQHIVQINNQGKKSITYFKIKKKYTNNTLMSIIPITGRTHQIRVHLQHLQYPIVSDIKYGKRQLDNYVKKNFHINRLLLHANAIDFIHPYHEKKISIKAPLDNIFTSFLNKLV